MASKKKHGLGNETAVGVQTPEEARAAAPAEGQGPDGAAPVRTLWGDAWKRLKRNRLAIIAVVWIAFIVLLAVTADLWVPQTFGGPNDQLYDVRMPMSAQHPFGTDQVGRDVFARVIYGARISLAVGLLATAISTVIGLVMGALAAYYGGIWDTIIMRLADIFLAFEQINQFPLEPPAVRIATLFMDVIFVRFDEQVIDMERAL